MSNCLVNSNLFALSIFPVNDGGHLLHDGLITLGMTYGNMPKPKKVYLNAAMFKSTLALSVVRYGLAAAV
jgi:hypothetical protein